MIIGKVVGPVVATSKHNSLFGQRLLLVKQDGDTTTSLIAVDMVSSGPGDSVLVCREGNGSRQVMEDPNAPVNATIIGIIDHIEKERE